MKSQYLVVGLTFWLCASQYFYFQLIPFSDEKAISGLELNCTAAFQVNCNAYELLNKRPFKISFVLEILTSSTKEVDLKHENTFAIH